MVKSLLDVDLDQMVLHHQEALAFVDTISDHVVREAVKFALHRAMTRFMRWEGQTDEEFVQQLPPGPFDALFFVQVLADTFSRKERLQRIFNGEIVDDFAVD